MSTRPLNRLMLICDRCAAEGPEAGSAAEVRAMGYVDGWRYPARTKADGKVSTRSDDVCPDCVGK